MLGSLSAGKLALVAALVQPALSLTASEWRDKTIYQVITDRFARPDSVTTACNVNDRKYCGGTWAALTDKLDYIQGMGFDAVWISPIVDNLKGMTKTGEAYHGYWSLDISKTNDNFGSAQDLKDLSAALHSRGMYLMVDVVVNHVASTDGRSFKPGGEHGPFDAAGDYHPYCVPNYSNQTSVEQCWLGDDNVILPDVDTEDQTVIDYYNAWIKQVVSDYSVDGIRIDTVKHVRKDFWPQFTEAAGVYAVGEVLDGSVDYLAPYTEVMDGILSYAVYYQNLYAFQNTGGSMATLANTYLDMAAKSKDNSLLGTFTEVHDLPRAASLIQDQMLLANHAAWPFVIDGIPIAYYGQEQGFSGGEDPANREPMWTSDYSTSVIGYEFLANLTAFRKQAGAADPNFYTSPAEISTFTQHEIVVSKGPMVAVLTNRGLGGASGTVSIPSNSSLPAATTVVDLFTCTSWQTDKDGASVVTVTNGQPQIILPLSDIGNLCGGGDAVVKSGSTPGSSDPPATSTKSRAPAATSAAPVTGGGTQTSGTSPASSNTADAGSDASARLALSSTGFGACVLTFVALAAVI